MGNEEGKTNKFNRTKIVTRIGVVVLASMIGVAGAAIIKEENEIDHATTYCPFCSVIGLKHQAKVINKENKFLAEYHYAGMDYDIINAECLDMDNGKIFSAPTGYTLSLRVKDTYITGSSISYDANAKTFTVYNDVKMDYLDNSQKGTVFEGNSGPSQTYTINADLNEGFVYAIKPIYHDTDYVEVYSSNAGVNSNGEVIAKTLVNTIEKPRIR